MAGVTDHVFKQAAAMPGITAPTQELLKAAACSHGSTHAIGKPVNNSALIPK
jgi:hypothetical protein